MPDPTMFEACQAIQTLIRYIGDDPERSGLIDTPLRVLEAWKHDWGTSYNEEPPDLKLFPDENYNEMILMRDIDFYSTCEHHLVTFYGKVHVGYIPDKRGIVGLSKLARVVNYFSRRLQVQERLCNQIADHLYENLSTNGVGVIIEAIHLCMVTRGVMQANSTTTTSALRGSFFENTEARNEFLKLGGMRGRL